MIFTTDYDHPLIARVHYLVRYLKQKGVDVRVINIPFEKKKKDTSSYIRSILGFPEKARAFDKVNSTLQLPHMPRKLAGNIGSVTNILHLILALVLVKVALRHWRCSAVVAMGPLAGFVANLSYKPRMGIIYEDTDPWADLSKGRLQKRFVSFLEAYCLKRASLVISNSELLIKRARNINSNSLLVPNGVDLSQFNKKRAFSSNPCLLYMGSINEWVGLEVVIESLPCLVEKNRKIMMNVCGDGVLRSELEKLVTEKGLRNHVTFLGKVPYAKLQELLLSSRVGIAMMKPSRFTFFASPLKLFEYMATGLPVVATDIGQLARTVRESGSGLCINWNTSEFVEAIERLLTDSDLWIKCHTNGLQYVKNYDWNILLGRWLDAVERHVASKYKK